MCQTIGGCQQGQVPLYIIFNINSPPPYTPAHYVDQVLGYSINKFHVSTTFHWLDFRYKRQAFNAFLHPFWPLKAVKYPKLSCVT